MATQIRITPDDMRTRATQYEAEADNINNVITSLDGLLSTLESEWEGEASTAFATKYADLRPAFASVEELVREIAAALVVVADSFEENDQTLATAFTE